jgi:carbonic anhydrase/acetyltransferase-like protein (isoleucine patch superfamily)/GNAT superfamily N-acetyltransferase
MWASTEGGPQVVAEVVCRPVERESDEVREFLAREWKVADQGIFGAGLDWVSRPIVVEARSGRALVGVAVGEAVAGMARLSDVLVAQSRQGAGVGGRLVELFCQRAAAAGAGRCFLRCPDTDRHRRFYERHGFVLIARIPRYYHGKDFLEYMREPLLSSPEARDASPPEGRAAVPSEPREPVASEPREASLPEGREAQAPQAGTAVPPGVRQAGMRVVPAARRAAGRLRRRLAGRGCGRPGHHEGMRVEHRGARPSVHPTAYVAPNAVLCGDVRIGEDARVLFGAVLTAEDGMVEVGARCVVMEHALLRGRANHPLRLGDEVLVGPHAHLNGAQVGDGAFLATAVSVFPGARVGAGAEVRVGGVVQVNSSLPPGATVPIGWVAVGAPAQILPPDRHEDIWAVQRGLDFPGTVYGVPRGTPMTEIMRAQADWFGAHLDDRLLE